MVLLIIIIFYFLAFVAYKKHRKTLSPMFFTPFLWATVLLFYHTIDHVYYDLNGQFIYAISIWVISFFIAGLIIESFTNHIKIKIFCDKTNVLRHVLFYITLFLSPIVAYLLYLDGISSGPEYLITRLRQLNTGQIDAENNLGVLVYVFNIAYISLLIEILEFKGNIKQRLRVVILIVINIILCLLTLAKTMFIFLLISIFVLFYFKNKIKTRHFLWLGVFIIILITSLTMLRSFSEDSNSIVETMINTFTVYVFSPLPAFETLNVQQLQFGGNTFRFFHVIIKAITRDEYYNIFPTILDWCKVPIETNIYTILYPFYSDFGFLGVFIFGLFYGVLFQIVFKLAVQGNKPMILFGGYLASSLVLQFMGDFVVTNLSNTIQCAVWFYLVYSIRVKLW